MTIDTNMNSNPPPRVESLKRLGLSTPILQPMGRTRIAFALRRSLRGDVMHAFEGTVDDLGRKSFGEASA